ncbi:MAG TPA: CBS domain-containing protein [Gaiellaceae bacterium]|nr:CBS domain-containing protein [Gaiellaceae bacterium]
MSHHMVRDVMTASPATVEPSSSIEDAARLMRDEDTGALPIVEGERLVGMITDRDIAIRAVAEGRIDATVGELASKDLVSIDPQQTLEEAGRLMAQHQVRRLPVCEEDGRLVGILAQADLAQSGHDQLTGEVVEQISQ